MDIGEARRGDVLYTRHKLEGEQVYRIVQVKVLNIVHQGTTNEYLQVLFQNLDGSAAFIRQPHECDKDRDRARNRVLLELQVEMDRLNQQFVALGVHTNSTSYWGGKK